MTPLERLIDTYTREDRRFNLKLDLAVLVVVALVAIVLWMVWP